MMITIPNYSLIGIMYESPSTIFYRSVREKDGKKVIIKLLKNEYPPAEEIGALKTEYQLLNSLQQAGGGTTVVYSMENEKQRHAIIMEDDGSELLSSIFNKKPLGLQQFFTISLSIIKVLGFLHSHSIIHKSINPSTILWNETTQSAKIIDLSFASTLPSEAPETQDLQKFHRILPYISPEQTGRTNRSLDYRTDFYSLGVTFYEMLTGHLPFATNDMLELIHNHLAKMPDSITKLNPKVPPMLAAVIDKLLAKAPEERYSSIVGLKADLTECQQQWEANGQIASFVLGQQDIKDHLILSQKLYGRIEQIDEMLAVFERIAQGKTRTELLLIGGYSGIGKTALVKEIYKPVLRQRGYIVSGKCDQMQRSTPYSALIEAFQELARRLLREPEDQLGVIKTSLMQKLGNNGQVITDIIPLMGLVLGPQPALPALSPTQAQTRFMVTFQNFVVALAQPDHPLVIFLDDLQWIDSASLELFQLLLTNKELSHFLLIGAYRDNEVTAEHPLLLFRQKLQKEGIPFNQIFLSPLKLEDIQSMLSDSLHVTQKRIIPFAELMLNRTQGNPFFINEFLRDLYHKQLLTFSYQTNEWEWDNKKIAEQAVTENVVDVVTSRFQILSDKAKQTLELAACIGHRFDLKTLLTISERPLNRIIQDLNELVQGTFITCMNDKYRLLETLSLESEKDKKYEKWIEDIEFRFAHDKIQQAAYQLILESKKKHTHLQIAHLLVQAVPLTEKDPRLLMIMDHFNSSIDLIGNVEERKQLAVYNLWAGKKAKASAAYQAAIHYLEKGLQLLHGCELPGKQETFFELAKELAVCQFLIGEHAKAQAGFNKLLQEAQAVLPALEVATMACYLLAALGKNQEAVELGLRTLETVKIVIPLHPARLRVLFSLLKTQSSLGWFKLRKLTLKPISSPESRAVLELLGQLVRNATAIHNNPPLLILLVTRTIQFSLAHGFTEGSVYPFIIYANFLLHRLHKRDMSFQLVDAVSALKNEYAFTAFDSLFYGTLGLTFDLWRFSFEKCIETLHKAYRSAGDESDLISANMSYTIITVYNYLLGRPLSELSSYYEGALNLSLKTKLVLSHRYFLCCAYSLKCLTKPVFEREKLYELMKEYNSALERGGLLTCALRTCYLFSDLQEGYKYWLQLEPCLRSIHLMATIVGVEAVFYSALLLMAMYSPNEKHLLVKIRKLCAKMRQWASLNPVNYQPFYLLLQAEWEGINQQIPVAMRLYAEAVSLAENQQILPLTAISSECAGRFYFNLKFPEIAKLYVIKAYQAYNTWGASTKCNLLEKQYPHWLDQVTLQHPAQLAKPTTIEAAATSVDVLSLLRSTQAISSEMHLEKLLQKLIVILLQNAGAQRGALLEYEAGDWYVEAEGTISAQHINLMQTERMETRTDLPLSLLRYTLRTREPILVQETQELQPFLAEDPYLAKIKPKSTLVMPVLNHGKLQTLLYLEHRTTAQAFTPEHMHILHVLSSQAAISLENARLFYQATRDPLTGLANRNMLYQTFALISNRIGRQKKNLAVLFLDMDGFKKINDTLGHEVGDKILIYFSQQIKLCLREMDLPARLGGDEFVILLEDAQTSDIIHIADRILERFKEPARIDGNEIYIGTSIGVSVYPTDGITIEELLKQADIALYRVKAHGKGHYQFYTSQLTEELQQENKEEKELLNAIKNGELLLHYQPTYNMSDGKISRLEALLRWRHPSKGLLNNNTFIPLAEKTDLILPLGEFVLETAIKQLSEWKHQQLPLLPVAVNVSGVQLKKQAVSALTAKLLQKYDIPPACLEIEFTESVFIEDSEKITEEITALKKMGIKLALDDFGMHYSNLFYLQRFSIDHLKIDQLFIKNMLLEEKSCGLVLAIITMAHTLKLRVIAEGVETAEQFQFLKEHEIDEVQGFYLSLPVNAEAITSLIQKELAST